MRFVGDLTPNHCGSTHPWFLAAQADPEGVEAGSFSFPAHPHEYLSWLGHATLPKFDHRDDELRWRLYEGPESVVARWLRAPYSMDGWRMDVANMTGHSGRVDLNAQVGRAMRRTLEATNPDALLIAEHAFGASALLDGDAYHGTMNYAGFADPVWRWLRTPGDLNLDYLPVPVPRLPGPTVAATMTAVRASAPWRAALHAFNQLGSHDSTRFRSVVGGDRDAQLAGAGLLFTSPGIPVVFAGDEVGLEGLDSLDARRPMPWDPAHWDTTTLDGYRRLIALRRAHPALRRGGFRWVHVGDDLLCYLREGRTERLLVAVSRAAHGPVLLPDLGSAEAEHCSTAPTSPAR